MEAHKLIIVGLIALLPGCNLHQPTYSERRASYIKDFESINHIVCSSVQINYDECMMKQRQGFGEIFDDEQRELAANRPTSTNNNNGTTVYSRDECIGPVIMGVCKGSLVPRGGYHKTCHGTMLNGRCTGPMF